MKECQILSNSERNKILINEFIIHQHEFIDEVVICGAPVNSHNSNKLNFRTPIATPEPGKQHGCSFHHVVHMNSGLQKR